MVVIFIANSIMAKEIVTKLRLTYWGETVALAAFGFAWIIAGKYFPLFVLFFILKTELLNEPLTSFLRDSMGLLAAVVIGSVLVPILLPVIPGRAFSFKGAFLGFLFALIWSQITAQSLLNTLTNLLIYTSAASYLALNFTGTSTFTNMSGVYQEMRISLPLIIPSIIVGLILYWF